MAKWDGIEGPASGYGVRPLRGLDAGVKLKMSDSLSHVPAQAAPGPATGWRGFGDRLAAYGSGVANAVPEMVKYPALGANGLMNVVGLRSDADTVAAAGDITKFMDAPPFIPDAVNQYREGLRSRNPEMDTIGNVVGGAIGGKGLFKNVKGFLDKVPKRVKDGYGPSVTGLGVGASVFSEGVVEPLLDGWHGR